MYANGRGAERNDVDAVAWYRKAAEQHHLGAMFKLGEMYANGRGVEKNDVEAATWYRKAAEQKHTKAQYNLGEMYASGRGVKKDDVEAVNWYRKAAEWNDVGAQYSLGWMYANGRGVEKDDVAAVEWYRKAAGQNHVKAQFNLGQMYANGRGANEDKIEAYAWTNLAAREDADAAKQRSSLEKAMTPQQIAHAQQRTRELRTSTDTQPKPSQSRDSTPPESNGLHPLIEADGQQSQSSIPRNESSFATVRLRRGIALEVPRTWWVLGKPLNDLLATTTEAVLDISGVSPSTEKDDNLFTANSWPPSTYASVRVDYSTPAIGSPDEVRSLTPEMLAKSRTELTSLLRRSLATQDLKLLDDLGIGRETVDGHPAIVQSYRRSGPKGPVVVTVYTVQFIHGQVKVALSYRESEVVLWKPIVQKMRDSIKISANMTSAPNAVSIERHSMPRSSFSFAAPRELRFIENRSNDEKVVYGGKIEDRIVFFTVGTVADEIARKFPDEAAHARFREHYTLSAATDLVLGGSSPRPTLVSQGYAKLGALPCVALEHTTLATDARRIGWSHTLHVFTRLAQWENKLVVVSLNCEPEDVNRFRHMIDAIFGSFAFARGEQAYFSAEDNFKIAFPDPPKLRSVKTPVASVRIYEALDSRAESLFNYSVVIMGDRDVKSIRIPTAEAPARLDDSLSGQAIALGADAKLLLSKHFDLPKGYPAIDYKWSHNQNGIPLFTRGIVFLRYGLFVKASVTYFQDHDEEGLRRYKAFFESFKYCHMKPPLTKSIVIYCIVLAVATTIVRGCVHSLIPLH